MVFSERVSECQKLAIQASLKKNWKKIFTKRIFEFPQTWFFHTTKHMDER